MVTDKDLYAWPCVALCDRYGKHCIETCSLSLGTSLGTLTGLKDRLKQHVFLDPEPTKKDRSSALIVGHPFFHGWLSQLPGADKEGAWVIRLRSDKFDTKTLHQHSAGNA